MPECTTCGNHVTHEYVRVFGDNENSVDSCRNCRSSTRGRDADGGEADQVVHLEDIREDETVTGNDTRDGPNAAEHDTSEGGDDADDGAGDRFGLGRLRSLFDR